MKKFKNGWLVNTTSDFYENPLALLGSFFYTKYVNPNENLVVGAVTLSHRKLIEKRVDESDDKSESDHSEGETDCVEKNKYLESSSIRRIKSHDLTCLHLTFEHEGGIQKDGPTDERINLNRYEIVSNSDEWKRSLNSPSNFECK